MDPLHKNQVMLTQSFLWLEQIKEQGNLETTHKALQAVWKKTFHEIPPFGLCNHPFSQIMGEVERNAFTVYMPGVAYIAHEIASKHGVQDLVKVPIDLDALMKAIKTDVVGKDAVDMAYVTLALHSRIPRNYLDSFPQHKIAVRIKTSIIEDQRCIQIMIIDPNCIGWLGEFDAKRMMNYDNRNIYDGRSEQDPGDPERIQMRHSSAELVGRAILHALYENSATPKDTKVEIYHSKLLLETIHGDAVCSIYNAVHAVKNPNFFKELRCEKEFQFVPGRNATVHTVNILPPIHMRGGQDPDVLLDYITRAPNLFKKTLPTGNRQTLEKSLEKYSFSEVVSGTPIWRNGYFAIKEWKHYGKLLRAAQENPRNLANKIHTTLVTK